MKVAPSPVGREAGRGLLTLANVITVVAPVAADWNDSHIFNRRWPSHARFHGVVALAMTSTLAGLNLWSLWSPLDLPPGGGHRGYAAVVDGSRLMVACCCSHSMGDR